MNRAFGWSCTAVVATGFLALGIAWRGSARVLAVGLQVPQVISGGFAGMGLIMFGLLIGSVHLSRQASASERIALTHLMDRTERLVLERGGRRR